MLLSMHPFKENDLTPRECRCCGRAREWHIDWEGERPKSRRERAVAEPASSSATGPRKRGAKKAPASSKGTAEDVNKALAAFTGHSEYRPRKDVGKL
jgi:hypothetical protein